jgi:Flavoprotein
MLAELTGYDVRSDYRSAGEATSLPEADAIAVAPATFNTVNKFRAGIADNMAMGVLCECLRAGVPIVLAPNVKAVLAQHPAFPASLRELASWGVHVLEQARGARMVPWEAQGLGIVRACLVGAGRVSGPVHLLAVMDHTSRLRHVAEACLGGRDPERDRKVGLPTPPAVRAAGCCAAPPRTGALTARRSLCVDRGLVVELELWERRAKRVAREPEPAGGPRALVAVASLPAGPRGPRRPDRVRNEDTERNLHHLTGHDLAQ